MTGTIDREALRRAIEALKPLGIVVRAPLGESRADALEMALSEFHAVRAEGWAVYGYAFFLPRKRPKAGATAPPLQIEVHAESQADHAAASRAIVDELQRAGLTARWSGGPRAAIELLAG